MCEAIIINSKYASKNACLLLSIKTNARDEKEHILYKLQPRKYAKNIYQNNPFHKYI